MKLLSITLSAVLASIALAAPVAQFSSGSDAPESDARHEVDHCFTTQEIYHTLPRSFTLLSNGTALTLTSSNVPTPSSSGLSQVFSLNNGLLTFPGNTAYLAAPLTPLATIRRVVFGTEQQGSRFEARPGCEENEQGRGYLEVLPSGQDLGRRFCVLVNEQGEQEVWVKSKGAGKSMSLVRKGGWVEGTGRGVKRRFRIEG
jgi:hypothetical protein